MGKPFVRLTGAALAEAVAGKTICYGICNDIAANVRVFYRDGRFGAFGDRWEGYGTYVISSDVVVRELEGDVSRLAFYIADDGSFAEALDRRGEIVWSEVLIESPSVPRQLTEQEVRRLMTGSYVTKIVPEGHQDLSTPEQFNSDGTYVRYADNREIEGHYSFKDGMFCVNVIIHPEYCRFIFVDDLGQVFTKSPNYQFVPVKIDRTRR